MSMQNHAQANDMGNNPTLELGWAIKAGEHADIYYNLICSVDPRFLQLSPVDDEIYIKFRQMFPEMKVDVLDENKMKSASQKLLWREFMEDFKEKIEEYNYGTLLRIDCKGGYEEKNTMFSVRTQFLAIEIARNRENLNSDLRFVTCSSKSPFSEVS